MRVVLSTAQEISRLRGASRQCSPRGFHVRERLDPAGGPLTPPAALSASPKTVWKTPYRK